MNRVDPTGNLDFIQTLVVGAIIGVIAGGIIGGIASGWRGAVKGMITGLVLGPLMALGITAGGAVIAGVLYAIFGSFVVSSQLAAFILGAGLTAWGIRSASKELDRIDLSSPTAQREILAIQVELIFMFIATIASAAAFGKSASVSREQGGRIRAIYDKSAIDIADTAEAMQKQGKSLEETATKCTQIRHDSRMAARQVMSEKMDVVMLQTRDTLDYGNPDGPTLEWLIADAKAQGLTGDDVWRYIISSASRTHAATSRQVQSFNK